MSINLKKFIADTLGQIPIELAHSMAVAAHEKFMEYFEDPDGDGVYMFKSDKIKLFDNTPVITVPVILRRVLDTMVPESLEFEFDTPMSFENTGDADNPDVQISLKKVGLFKSHSNLKVKLTMVRTDPVEGLELIREEANQELHKQLQNRVTQASRPTMTENSTENSEEENNEEDTTNN